MSQKPTDKNDSPLDSADSGEHSSVPDLTDEETLTPEEAEKRRRLEVARQLSMVVCICKGINLGRVLKGLEGSETVADVNKRVGTGSGGCAGQRCGPRIKILLKKMKDKKNKSGPSSGG